LPQRPPPPTTAVKTTWVTAWRENGTATYQKNGQQHNSDKNQVTKDVAVSGWLLG